MPHQTTWQIGNLNWYFQLVFVNSVAKINWCFSKSQLKCFGILARAHRRSATSAKSFQLCRVLEWVDECWKKTRNCKPHMMKPCLIGANYVDLKSMASSITFLFEMFETFPTWSPHPVEASQEAHMHLPLPAEKGRGNVSTRKTPLDTFSITSKDCWQ